MDSVIMTDNLATVHYSPCSAYLEGEYGIQGLYVGVPVKLGAQGIEKIFEVNLTEDECAALLKSAAAVQELVDVMAPKLA
jgi:malate dehydrogenase